METTLQWSLSIFAAVIHQYILFYLGRWTDSDADSKNMNSLVFFMDILLLMAYWLSNSGYTLASVKSSLHLYLSEYKRSA